MTSLKQISKFYDSLSAAEVKVENLRSDLEQAVLTELKNAESLDELSDITKKILEACPRLNFNPTDYYSVLRDLLDKKKSSDPNFDKFPIGCKVSVSFGAGRGGKRNGVVCRHDDDTGHIWVSDELGRNHEVSPLSLYRLDK